MSLVLSSKVLKTMDGPSPPREKNSMLFFAMKLAIIANLFGIFAND